MHANHDAQHKTRTNLTGQILHMIKLAQEQLVTQHQKLQVCKPTCIPSCSNNKTVGLKHCWEWIWECFWLGFSPRLCDLREVGCIYISSDSYSGNSVAYFSLSNRFFLTVFVKFILTAMPKLIEDSDFLNPLPLTSRPRHLTNTATGTGKASV